LSEARRLYQSPGPQFYPGNTVAPFNVVQKTGQNLALEGAGDANAYNKLIVHPAAERLLNSPDVANNPYVQNMVQAAQQPILQQLTEQVLPQIRTAAAGTGNYGGTKQQLGEAQAVERTARAMGDVASTIMGNAYGQGLGTATSVVGMTPQLMGASLIPGQAYMDVGQQQQAQEQAKINEDLARWQWNQNLPYQKLSEYANAIGGQYGGQGTSKVEATGGTNTQTIAGLLSLVPGLADLLKYLFNW